MHKLRNIPFTACVLIIFIELKEKKMLKLLVEIQVYREKINYYNAIDHKLYETIPHTEFERVSTVFPQNCPMLAELHILGKNTFLR